MGLKIYSLARTQKNTYNDTFKERKIVSQAISFFLRKLYDKEKEYFFIKLCFALAVINPVLFMTYFYGEKHLSRERFYFLLDYLKLLNKNRDR